MPYIGNEVGNRFVASKAASVYSGDGSTTAFTLEHAVGSDEDILVSVDGVIQEPSVAYAVSSGTTLTFTAAPSSNSGNNIFVYYLFRTVATVDHPSTSSLQATDGTFTAGITGTLQTAAQPNITSVGTLTGFTSTGIDDNADATAITIDGSEHVGLKTTTPSDMYYNDLVVNSGDEGGITILDTSSGQTSLAFADGTSGNARYRGRILYDHSTDSLSIGTAGEQYWTMNSAHIITTPKQPAFLADCNYTGSGLAINTTHTVPALNERFDQNGDYNTSTYTFTAPVTGKYQLNGHFYVHAFDDTTNYVQFFITTSNRTYAGIIDNTLTSADVDNYNNSISVLADMDVNDTAKLQLNIPNSGAAQMAVSNLMNFSGYLVA
jgi:hypothetical protein